MRLPILMSYIASMVSRFTVAPSAYTMSFNRIKSRTIMVESNQYQLTICLSPCSEVFLIHKPSRQLVHQYPASHMMCGSASLL